MNSIITVKNLLTESINVWDAYNNVINVLGQNSVTVEVNPDQFEFIASNTTMFQITNAVGEYTDVQVAGSKTLYDGQTSVTTIVIALPTQAGSEVVLQSDPSNTANILIGSSEASQHLVLSTGASMTLSIANLNMVYAVASTGTQKLNWMVRT